MKLAKLKVIQGIIPKLIPDGFSAPQGLDMS